MGPFAGQRASTGRIRLVPSAAVAVHGWLLDALASTDEQPLLRTSARWVMSTTTCISPSLGFLRVLLTCVQDRSQSPCPDESASSRPVPLADPLARPPTGGEHFTSPVCVTGTCQQDSRP